MGDAVRRRVALWLGLGRVWVELDALSTRVRLLEQDAEDERAIRFAEAGSGVSRSPVAPEDKLPAGLFESQKPKRGRA